MARVLRLGIDPTQAVAGQRVFSASARKAAASAWDIDSALKGVAASFGLLAAAGAVRGAVRGALEYETAITGVAKTVEATESELSALGGALSDLSEEIPVARTELLGIAEAAGQLGIETRNIEGFVAVMADLGVATNLGSEEAATALARLANVMGTNQTEFDRLGATIVDLGNNLATTEAEIVAFAQRLAGAGKIAGLTEADVLSIGGALSSVGVEAEAGGTAVQKALIGMNTAVAEGGAELEAFARLAGTSAEEFAETWRTDASEGFRLFVEGLASAGDGAAAALEELGLGGARSTRSFLSLANAGDLLAESLERGSEAWTENTALTEEAERFYGTTANQLTTLRNELANTAGEIGATFVPALRAITENFETVKQAAVSLGLVLGAVGLAAAVSASVTAFVGFSGALLALVPAVNSAAAALALLQVALGPAGWLVLGLSAATAAVFAFLGASKGLREEQEKTEQATLDLVDALRELDSANAGTAVRNLTTLFQEQERVVASLQEKVDNSVTGGLGVAQGAAQAELATATAELERLETALVAAAGRYVELGDAATVANESAGGGGGGSSFVAPLVTDLELATEHARMLKERIAEIEGLEMGLAGDADELAGMVAEVTELRRQLDRLPALARLLALDDGTVDVISRFDDHFASVAESAASAETGIRILGGEIRSIEGGAAAAAEEMEALRNAGAEGAEGFSSEWTTAISTVGGALGGLASQVANVATAFLSGGAVAGAIAGIGAALGAITGGSQSARERDRILESNTDALLSLRTALENQGITEDETSSAAERLAQIIADLRSSPTDALSSSFRASGGTADFLNSDLVTRIADEQGIELFQENGRVIKDALEQLLEAMGLYGEALVAQEAAFMRDLEVRRLYANGLDAEADALRRTIEQEEELAEARAAGFSEEALAALRAVQAQEDLARAQNEAARAAEEAAANLFAQRQNGFGIQIREAELAGNDRGALELRLQAQAEAELQRAQELLDAGRLTQEMFARLTDLIRGEATAALADFENSLDEAAEAARLAGQKITNDLNLRLLQASGNTGEARALQNLLELEEARRRGYTEEQIALLEQVQAAEAAASAQRNASSAARDTARSMNRVARALNAPDGLRLSLLRFQASALSSRSSARNRLRDLGGGRGGGGATNLNMTFNVRGNADPREIARTVREAFNREARAGADPFTLSGA